MALKDAKFEEGKNYRLKAKRTIVEYCMFEIYRFKKGVAPDKTPACMVHDLPGNMRCYAGFQENDITVTDIDSGEVVYQSPKVPRKKKEVAV